MRIKEILDSDPYHEYLPTVVVTEGSTGTIVSLEEGEEYYRNQDGIDMELYIEGLKNGMKYGTSYLVRIDEVKPYSGKYSAPSLRPGATLLIQSKYLE